MEKQEKDKLDLLFEKQIKLQEKLETGKIYQNQEYINLMLLAINDELMEAMRETNWKNPKEIKYGWKIKQEFNEDNFKNELVDVWHFLINLTLASGMDSKELFSKYTEKNKENHARKDKKY